LGRSTTARAALDFRLVFGHDQPQGRQLIFLPLGKVFHRGFFQGSLTVGATLDGIPFRPIRIGGQLQPMAGMPRLGAAFLVSSLL
jgi:hypothetical protein